MLAGLETPEERSRRLQEMYPEQIPMASGGRTGYQTGFAVRQPTQIPYGFSPGFSPEFMYFSGLNPTLVLEVRNILHVLLNGILFNSRWRFLPMHFLHQIEAQ